jgi:hypothetical protein
VVVELELIQIEVFCFDVYVPVDAIRTRISFRARQAFHYNCIVQGDQKILCAPGDYSTKTHKNILNSFNHHDNVVRIRDNRWR